MLTFDSVLIRKVVLKCYLLRKHQLQVDYFFTVLILKTGLEIILFFTVWTRSVISRHLQYDRDRSVNISWIDESEDQTY